MKNLIASLVAVLITTSAYCQFSAVLKNASIAECSWCMAIGHNIHLASDSVIIIGDYEAVYIQIPPTLTIRYDRNFWYFKTPKGKSLLRYLDIQTRKKRTKERFMIIYNHIQKYYSDDIYQKAKTR